MALHINCDFCGAGLDEQGGLLLGPPVDARPLKEHLCGECYDSVMVPCRKTPECVGDIRHKGECYIE